MCTHYRSQHGPDMIRVVYGAVLDGPAPNLGAYIYPTEQATAKRPA